MASFGTHSASSSEALSRKRRLVRSGWVRSPSPARASLSASCRAFSSASIAEEVLLEEGRGRDGDFDFAGEAPRAGGVDLAGEAARARAGDFAGRRGEAAAAFFGGMERVGGVVEQRDATQGRNRADTFSWK